MGSTELDEPKGAHGHCYDILLVDDIEWSLLIC